MLEYIDQREAELLAGNKSHEDADVEVEAEDINTLTDTQLDDTKATFSQTLAEIEILKKDTPEIDTRKNQEKKKTRRGTRGKGRKIHYKKKGEQVMSSMKTLNAAAVMRLFIILVLAVHMAPGVRSGNKASEVIMADYPNSIDDEFVGCKEEMYNQVKQLLKNELNSNGNFRDAWNKAENHPSVKTSKSDSELTEKELRQKLRKLAILVYTLSPIHRDLNAKMREGRGAYLTGFGFISLHFLITDVIQTFNAIDRLQHKCRTTYRRTNITIKITDPSVRFGSFASSSIFPTKKHFGSETCFSITTCYGADVSMISGFGDAEAEVLIPPYEVFKSEPVTAKLPGFNDCKHVYKLSSEHKKSNMNCEYLKTDKMG
ncbi:hypothetical protein AOLI_G00243080 [Acnodon oligacanthus]